MKTIYCTLAIIIVSFFGGCGTAERFPDRAAETAVIACEAAHVTIQAEPHGGEEGGNDEYE